MDKICKIKGTNEMKRGAAIQYLNRSDGYHECEVIGHYDESRDDTYFNVTKYCYVFLPFLFLYAF